MLYILISIHFAQSQLWNKKKTLVMVVIDVDQAHFSCFELRLLFQGLYSIIKQSTMETVWKTFYLFNFSGKKRKMWERIYALCILIDLCSFRKGEKRDYLILHSRMNFTGELTFYWS